MTPFLTSHNPQQKCVTLCRTFPALAPSPSLPTSSVSCPLTIARSPRFFCVLCGGFASGASSVGCFENIARCVHSVWCSALVCAALFCQRAPHSLRLPLFLLWPGMPPFSTPFFPPSNTHTTHPQQHRLVFYFASQSAYYITANILWLIPLIAAVCIWNLTPSHFSDQLMVKNELRITVILGGIACLLFIVYSLLRPLEIIGVFWQYGLSAFVFVGFCTFISLGTTYWVLKYSG